MTNTSPAPGAASDPVPAPPKDHGRAGRDLPAAVDLRGRAAGRDRRVAGLLEDRVHADRGRRGRGGGLGAPQGVPREGHRPARAAAHARRRGHGRGRLLLRRAGAGHRHRGQRARHHALAAAPRHRRLRHERHRLGVHADLRAVPRLVRRADARRGRHHRRRTRRRRRPGHHHLHRGHDRLRHRRLHRRRALRQAPDGPGHLPEEVLGGLRRLAGLLRRRRRRRWSSTCSTGTGGSASRSG